MDYATSLCTAPKLLLLLAVDLLQKRTCPLWWAPVDMGKFTRFLAAAYPPISSPHVFSKCSPEPLLRSK